MIGYFLAEIREMYKMECIKNYGSWQSGGEVEVSSKWKYLGVGRLKREVRIEGRRKRSMDRICQCLRWRILQKAKKYREGEKIAKLSGKMRTMAKETLRPLFFKAASKDPQTQDTKYQTLIYEKEIIKLRRSLSQLESTSL